MKNEASFLTTDQPVQFQPNPDPSVIRAWKNTLSGTPAGLGEPDPVLRHPEFWYFNK